MSQTPLTKGQGISIVKLFLGGMLCMLLVVGYVFYTGYSGRVEVVKAQRAGCERSKLDRSANARGWRNAETARAAAGQYIIAAQYADIASELEARSEIICSRAFKKASLIP